MINSANMAVSLQTVDDSDIPLLLLANKKDLKEARVVDPQLVEALAKEHNIPYYEVSALTGENIEESLTEFAKGIYQQKQKKREVSGWSRFMCVSQEFYLLYLEH